MKVIIKKCENKQVECDCGALLEYTIDDIKTGAFGCAYITCPECNQKVYEINEDGKDITVDNIVFPQDFTDPSEGITVEDKEINKWIKRCIDTLEKDEADYGVSSEIGLGNAMVFVKKLEDEYCVWVTRSYYETAIPRF